MTISCLTVTRPGRLPLLQRAIADYRRQTHAARELVILHDGDTEFDTRVRALAQGDASISVYAAEPATLGSLRNHSVALARGELICQWDDDDRYHPQRLELQLAALQKEQADFCFLQDQLHWFAASGELSWDDWNCDSYPLNFIQGSLLGRRALMPQYPELRRGEDTVLCQDILRAGHRIARLRGQGWCYVYVYHGLNVFEAAHHAAITRAKNLAPALMLGREKLLRQRLAEYAPPLPRAVYQGPGVMLDFSTASTSGSSSNE